MPFARRYVGSPIAETKDTSDRNVTVQVANIIGVTKLTDTTARITMVLGGDMDVKATEAEVLAVWDPIPDYVEPPEPPEPGDLTGGLLRIEPNGGGLAYQLAGQNRKGDWALLQQNGPEIIVTYLWDEPGVPGINDWLYLGVVNG